jgi:hypothetical protein
VEGRREGARSMTTLTTLTRATGSGVSGGQGATLNPDQPDQTPRLSRRLEAASAPTPSPIRVRFSARRSGGRVSADAIPG